jgi:HTH-type transcriptional regulator/antitoxin HigA
MPLRPIKTPEDYRAAKARADELMGNVEEGSLEAAELELLAILLERYEHDTFPIDPPSPIEAIIFRMEQMRYTQADLARLLGSRSRASEIMTGSIKRLSLSQIRRLHNEWHIPAEVLIRDATRGLSQDQAREGPATLAAPKPEIVDRGKVRIGNSGFPACFPPLRQPKSEPCNPYVSARCGLATAASSAGFDAGAAQAGARVTRARNG